MPSATYISKSFVLCELAGTGVIDVRKALFVIHECNPQAKP